MSPLVLRQAYQYLNALLWRDDQMQSLCPAALDARHVLTVPDDQFAPHALDVLHAAAVPSRQVGLRSATPLQQLQAAFSCDPHAFVRCGNRTAHCRLYDEVPILKIHPSR